IRIVIEIDFNIFGMTSLIYFSDKFIGLSSPFVEITFVIIFYLKKNTRQSRSSPMSNDVKNVFSIKNFVFHLKGSITGIEPAVMDSKLEPFTRLKCAGSFIVSALVSKCRKPKHT